jgi:protein-tyrosine-phosphatase
MADERKVPEADGESWRADVEALRAARPRHILFVCVANASRSQLAEGIARSLAPASVKVSSAGTQPWIVHPTAIEVLEELGIDPSAQRSKSIDEIDLATVDAVITLCDQDACPIVRADAQRFHWPLPDPTFVRGGPQVQLDAFRRTRDELRLRLGVLFEGRTR